MITFGKVIEAARVAKGMKQAEAAAASGVTPQYWNDLERDRRLPSEEVSQRIAVAIGVSADYLIYLSGKFPADVLGVYSEDEFVKRMRAFRRNVK